MKKVIDKINEAINAMPSILTQSEQVLALKRLIEAKDLMVAAVVNERAGV